LVEGYEAGADLVTHRAIKAVGFTGSTSGGRALFDLAVSRPDPIPFYGELGSLNPLVVTSGAVAERADEIAEGYVGSMTLGNGQFCTKPGLVFAPVGSDGLRFSLADAVSKVSAGPMLSESIRDAYQAEVTRRRNDARLTLVAAAEPGPADLGTPALFAVAAADLEAELLEECFGPSALLVEYRDFDELMSALGRLGGQLTASVHAVDGEHEVIARLHDELRQIAGRLVFGGYPTGVAVTWAMHHGGPYPASTSSAHTSVGATSIRRWLRPISYQNAPEAVLPEELRDGNPAGIPRRVDGVLA
jgi:NADP-dependent aldehyde dehydrogenase